MKNLIVSSYRERQPHSVKPLFVCNKKEQARSSERLSIKICVGFFLLLSLGSVGGRHRNEPNIHPSQTEGEDPAFTRDVCCIYQIIICQCFVPALGLKIIPICEPLSAVL